MAVEVFMPKAGMDMKEGTIIKWLANVGDKVSEGDGILEIETDKVTMEVEAPADGVLLCKYFEDGAVVPVVTVIGYIGKEGEKVPDAPTTAGGDVKASDEAAISSVNTEKKEVSSTATGKADKAFIATPYAKKLARENTIDLSMVVPSGPFGEIKARDVLEAIDGAAACSKVLATPLAQKMAADMGVDLANVVGTGYNGKITKEDILNAKDHADSVSAQLSKGDRRVPLTGMRRVVAERMMKSYSEIPSVTVNTKVDVTKLMELRKALIEQCEVKYSVNDMIIKAVALALADNKEMLCEFAGDAIIYKDAVNVGMAVSVPNGLLVPVIRDADKMSLSEISATAKDLATRTRNNKLSMDECKGSNFSISNMGMFGVETFNPIINQPDSAILGVNAIDTELALVNGQAVEKKVMRLSLTFDHRLMDGVQAAKFNLSVKEYLENPMKIVL